MKYLRICSIFVLSLALGWTIGCNTQATAASLADILGTATSSLAALEGNEALAAKITADTNVAVSAIQNWKSGTPSELIVESLNLVESDLNLFPINGQEAALVDLAIGTAEEIITLVEGANPPITSPSVQTRSIGRRSVPPNKSIKNAKDFKKAWNQIVASNPALSRAELR